MVQILVHLSDVMSYKVIKGISCLLLCDVFCSQHLPGVKLIGITGFHTFTLTKYFYSYNNGEIVLTVAYRYLSTKLC